LILMHNHPTGDPSPSSADTGLTKKIKKAGAELLDLDLVDHIIVGKADSHHEYFSFREAGII